MPDETENHTLHMLREMREESRQFRAAMDQRFDKVDAHLAQIDSRLDLADAPAE